MGRLTVLIIGLFPFLSFASNDPLVWLERMNQAVQTLSYEGTFVYTHDDEIETMQIAHSHGPDGERERLVSLSGDAREMIRDRGVLTCIWPGSRSVVVEPARAGLEEPVTAGESLEAYYVLSLAGTERIAGLTCQMVAIDPRDQYRYGYRLCIDEASGMLLKSVMLDEQQQPIEQLVFTNIELTDTLPSEYFESEHTDGAALPPLSADVLSADELAWSLGELPPGFALQSVMQRPMREGGAPVHQMIVSDGLASVSVFIAVPESAADVYEGLTGAGALHAYARVLDGHQVTVVGEVPAETVRLIGAALAQSDAAEQP